jgi:hypothetical protein
MLPSEPTKITLPNQLKELFRQELMKFRAQAESNLGDADRKRRNQIDAVLSALLKELETSGHLDMRFTSVQADRLFDILRKVRDVAVVYNSLIEIFSDEARENKFLNAVQEFGIGRIELVQMYLATYATACVLSTESFKLLVLFQTKGIHKVSDFNSVIPRLAPHSWPTLKTFVDNIFRNALAHGLYTVEKGKAVLYKNTKLEVCREMTGLEFIMEVKNQNILFWSALLMFLERILERMKNTVK